MKRIGWRRLTAQGVTDARERYRRGETFSALARDYGVGPATMASAIVGRTFKWVPDPCDPRPRGGRSR